MQQLCSLYISQVQSERAGSKETDVVFLSQLSLDPFHKAEESYSRELTNFTKKLFFEVHVCVCMVCVWCVCVLSLIHI